MARRPDGRRAARRAGPPELPSHPPDFRRLEKRPVRRRPGAEDLRHPPPSGARTAGRVFPKLQHEDGRLQRPDAGDADRSLLQGSCGRNVRVAAGARPSALQHEHVSDVAAGPSVPLSGPQRRNQHAARQPEPRPHTRGLPENGPFRRRSEKAAAADRRDAERFRLSRQHGRTACAVRPLAAACHDDADPPGMGRQLPHDEGHLRFLRLPFRLGRAMGRPRRRFVHRRRRRGRHAGPQRPPPRPLFTDERRPVRARLRNRRARSEA